IIVLILANIIWGASLPIYKWTLEQIQPFTFAFLRFFISFLILLPFVIKDFKFEKKDIPKLIFASIVSITIQIPLLFFGLKLAPSINAPIIISAGPILLLGSSVIFLKEKISPKLLAGTLISLFGVMVLMFNPALESGFSGAVLGNFFIFLATICSVIQALIIKKIVERNGALITVFLTFLIGSFTLMLPAFLEYNSLGLFPINLKFLIGISYAVILSSILAHYFLFFGLKNIKVSETGVFTYVDPIATILVAIPLLHEVITESYLIATVLVFLGIYIAEGRVHYHPFHLLKKSSLNKLSERME
ncbi:MAG: DMT family transporter, partial [Phenylobacterium sp.]|uniref:DMT family transporter n=1 Tax=Phenylobacterium sp. TaxID=1871053 RepID=UPI00273671F2